MNLFEIAAFTAACVNFALALFVVWQNPKAPLHRAYFIWGLGVVLWNASVVVMISNVTPETALAAAKLLQFGIKPFENDIDIILELYLFGGYSNSEEQTKFIDICMEKGLKKSVQSVRNTLSKYVSIGLFDKPKNTILHINEKFIPNVSCDRIILEHKISHAK